MKAIDIANYTSVPTAAQCACLKSNGYGLAIVGCSYGTLAGPQLSAFVAGGIAVEAYAWVQFSPSWQGVLDRALAVIQNYPVKRLWLDCEGAIINTGQTVARINAAIGYVQSKRPDLTLGIYTGGWWWKPNTADSQAFKHMPLWTADYVQDPGHDPTGTPKLYGGWTEAAIWQYAGTIDTCGLNTDRNVIMEEDDMAITLVWNPDFQRLYVLGEAAPVWITDPVVAADLQRAFGAPKVALSWGTLLALGAK